MVFIPALLFDVLTDQADMAEKFIVLRIAAVCVVLGSGLLAWPIARLIRIDPKTFCPPMMFRNAGNIGLLLMVMAFGKQALPAAVAVFLVENLLHITVGSYLLDHRSKIFQIVSFPMVIAVSLAIGVSVIGVSIHPTVMLPVEMLD